MNKILGIDIDDCICNTLEMDLASVLYFAEKKEIKLPKDAWTCDDFYVAGAFNLSKNNEQEFYLKEKEFIIKHNAMYPKVFVKEVFEKLKQKGFKIVLMTSRLNYFWKNNSYKYCKKWLKKHKIKYDKLYTNLSDKTEICKKINLDFMIEDNQNFVKILNENNIKTILIKTAYNQNYGHKNNFFAYNWLDLYAKLGKIYNFETDDLIFQ